MGEGIRKSQAVHEVRPTALGELIHEHVRGAIERAVVEELARALGAAPYERSGDRRGWPREPLPEVLPTAHGDPTDSEPRQ